MKESLAIVVGQLAVLTALGWMALAPLPRPQREVLLPATPVFGAALVAVTMSTTSWFWGATVGAWIAVGLAVGLLGWAIWRKTRPWRTSWRAVATAAAVFAVALPGLFVALLPTHDTGDSLAVMPGSNHDLFFYSAESTWLHDHPITPGPHFTDIPGQGNATPAYGPMAASLAKSLRIGQPTVASVLDVLLGKQSVQTMTPLVALWAFLVGPAAYVAARLLRARLGTALAVSALSATSAVLVQQAFQQNMDSLLGASLALLTIATTLAALDRRCSRWPAVLTLAGLVAVYTEYALFVAPALLGALVLRHHRFRARLWTMASIGLGAVAIAPTAWVRGLRTLTLDHSRGAPWGSFFSDGRLLAASRALGLTPLWGAVTPPGRVQTGLVLVLAGLLATGLGLAVVLHRDRGAWIGLLGVGGLYLALVTYQHHDNAQFRVMSIFLPLVVLVTVLGWGEAYRHGRRRLRSRYRPERAGNVVGSVMTVVALLVASLGLANLRTSSGVLQPDLARARHVDQAYAEAASWVRQYGGPGGENVTVVNPNIDTQMWLVYTLRDFPDVSYPALQADYLHSTRYWDGQVDRYYVVGTGGFVSGDVDVVARNERFALVRLGDGPSLVATPTNLPSWSTATGPDGSMTGSDLSQVLVMTHGMAPAQPVTITVGSTADGPVAAVVDGRTLTVGTITDGVGVLRVPWGTDPQETVRLDLGADGQADPGTLTLIGASLDP